MGSVNKTKGIEKMGIPNSYENEINDIAEDQFDDEVSFVQKDEKWRIKDLGTATWADSIIHEKELIIEEKEKIADNAIVALQDKIKRLEEWKVEASKKENNDIDFFKEHLILWHKGIIQEEESQNKDLISRGKKEKALSITIKLPYRDLTCRKQKPEGLIEGLKISDVKDNPTFVKFVEENNPEFIKKEVKWGDYKKTLTMVDEAFYIDGNGQILDFIKMEYRETKYDWKKRKEV